MAFVPVELNLKWLQKTFVTRTIQNSSETEKLQIFVEGARKNCLVIISYRVYSSEF